MIRSPRLLRTVWVVVLLFSFMEGCAGDHEADVCTATNDAKTDGQGIEIVIRNDTDAPIWVESMWARKRSPSGALTPMTIGLPNLELTDASGKAHRHHPEPFSGTCEDLTEQASGGGDYPDMILYIPAGGSYTTEWSGLVLVDATIPAHCTARSGQLDVKECEQFVVAPAGTWTVTARAYTELSERAIIRSCNDESVPCMLDSFDAPFTEGEPTLAAQVALQQPLSSFSPLEISFE